MYSERPNHQNVHIWNSNVHQAAHGSSRQRSAAILFIVHSTIGFPSNGWASCCLWH